MDPESGQPEMETNHLSLRSAPLAVVLLMLSVFLTGWGCGNGSQDDGEGGGAEAGGAEAGAPGDGTYTGKTSQSAQVRLVVAGGEVSELKVRIKGSGAVIAGEKLCEIKANLKRIAAPIGAEGGFESESLKVPLSGGEKRDTTKLTVLGVFDEAGELNGSIRHQGATVTTPEVPGDTIESGELGTIVIPAVPAQEVSCPTRRVAFTATGPG